MSRIKELRAKRAKLVEDARALSTTAETEKRELTSEEEARFNDMLGPQLEKLDKAIQNEERLAEAERASAATDEQERRQREQDGGGSGSGGGERRTLSPRETPEYLAAFGRYLSQGRAALTDAELRNLSSGVNVQAGYLVPPMQFVDELLRNVDNLTFIRARARKFRMETAETMGTPSLDADPDDFDWTTELLTGSEDRSMKVGRREMRAHPLAKRIKASKNLLRRAPNAESMIRERFAYKFGITMEKAYLTGNGNQRPLGLFTASADGIPTSRDVSTGNTTTQLRWDGLMEAKYSLKAQYWRGAVWMFHRDGCKHLAKLKDGDGQYIWQPAIQAGEPDMIRGNPVLMSEYVPNTFTTGQYVGLFGDLSYYWIVDALDMQMQRLDELYAETNQTGFIARYEGDGAPVLAEAFARIKLA